MNTADLERLDRMKAGGRAWMVVTAARFAAADRMFGGCRLVTDSKGRFVSAYLLETKRYPTRESFLEEAGQSLPMTGQELYYAWDLGQRCADHELYGIQATLPQPPKEAGCR